MLLPPRMPQRLLVRHTSRLRPSDGTALFIPDTPHHTSQPTQIAEEEKGQFIAHLSFDARSVWRGGTHCCCVRHGVQSYSHGEETGGSVLWRCSHWPNCC